MTLSATGCLSIDSLEARPETPPVANHPPRFQNSSLSPSNARTIEPGPEINCQVTLSAGVVIDEDVNDILQARWFVDYDASPEAHAVLPDQSRRIERNVTPETFPFIGTVRLNGKAERTGDSFIWLTNKYPRGVHVLTLMVSDGFTNNLQNFQEVAPGYGYDVVTWSIDTTRATECK